MPKAILENVVVARSARGQGLGKRLISHCLESLRLAGVRKVSLLTNHARTDPHVRRQLPQRMRCRQPGNAGSHHHHVRHQASLPCHRDLRATGS